MRFIKNNWLLFTILAAVVMVLVFVFYPQTSKKEIVSQDNFVLYYGDTCPHCIALDKYMVDNNIEARLPKKLIKKEVFNNESNSQELSDRASICNISPVGVPFLWDDGKCYVGEPDAKKYLEDLILTK